MSIIGTCPWQTDRELHFCVQVLILKVWLSEFKVKAKKIYVCPSIVQIFKVFYFWPQLSSKKYWCLLLNILRTNCPIGTGFFSQTGINVLSQVAKMGGCRGEERVNTRWIEKVLILCFTILLLYLIFISNSQNVLCL